MKQETQAETLWRKNYEKEIDVKEEKDGPVRPVSVKPKTVIPPHVGKPPVYTENSKE